MVEQSHEFSAKSIEAAIEEGLRRLGVGRDRVDIEILHEGSRGLLGLGRPNPRVRMALPPAPKPAEKPAPAPVPAAVAPVPTPAVAAIPQEVDESDEEEDDLPVAVASALDDNDDDEAYDDDSDVDRDEGGALAGEMLLEMVTLMGLEARVEGSQRDDPDENDTAIYLNLLGDDLGALIGRHGETLASMQYLLRLMVNQKLHRWTNIVVDVEGYKDRRAEKLAQMALRMADQVVETGRPVALEPMPANERRIIHIALRNHPRVYTESTGEDTRRKIQILLK